MQAKSVCLVLGVSLMLLIAVPVLAQEATTGTVYYYRDGQAVPAVRHLILAGDGPLDATVLLEALLLGPTREEQDSGLYSPLPQGTQIAAVTIDGEDVTVFLDLPTGFALDASVGDAIIDQVSKTLHPLGLHQIHLQAAAQVVAEGSDGDFVPISDLITGVEYVPPGLPTNDDTSLYPEEASPGPVPEHSGQPPVPGQGQAQGALAGKTVWLSAGHGWYWSDLLQRWNSQRPNTFGVVEDFANAEAVNYYLARYLWNAGADVRLVRERSMNENEVIVDNDHGAPTYSETGPWYTSVISGYEGGSYRHAPADGAGTATATWTPNLPKAGRYAVWAWFLHGENRAGDATYQIHHAGGTTQVQVSQEVHGQTWRYLGDFYFEAGTTGRVTLTSQSGDVGQAIVSDAIRFGGGMGSIVAPGGTSNQPRWEEAATAWIEYQGAPAWLYDGHDSAIRPLYAEWETAKGYPGEADNGLYVSWHTNAGGGTGTNTYIHDTRLPAGSGELQDWVHAELVGDIRAAWNPEWVDRGQKSADFAELRGLSTMPGVLLEVAFHDTEDPGDADDLREPLFRQIAARAVYQGIVRYFAHRDSTPSHLLPEPPARLAARYSGPGKVTLGWAPPPCCNEVVGDAATAYKVYQSNDGRGFDNGTKTANTSLQVTGLAPGSLIYFRVTALNEGGESFPTPVVAVRTPANDTTATLLIVDGFGRLDQSALIPQWESPALGTAKRMFLERMNDFDYAILHGQALGTCQVAFDGAVAGAVSAGDVPLAGYDAVDWFTGENSVDDGTLDPDARGRLAAYLDAGGRLLLSGSDIGLDLAGSGRAPSFYEDTLGAVFQGDDADTYVLAGNPGGFFAGLAGSLDDGSGGTYDVDRADYMTATDNAMAALSYSGGKGSTAAVAKARGYRVFYAGFPLESVQDAQDRADLFCTATEFLISDGLAGVQVSEGEAASAQPGRTVTFGHTVTHTGKIADEFAITFASSQGWASNLPASLRLDSGEAATLVHRVTVGKEAAPGTVDHTVLTLVSQVDPTISDTITTTTTAIALATPRLINPGFEGGREQSAWQTSAATVLVHRDNLPPYAAPHGGNWVAWLEAGQTLAAGVGESRAITQVVALPSGEPTATLTLAWLGHNKGSEPAVDDVLTAGVYDLGGSLLQELLRITAQSLTGDWQEEVFDLGAYAGQTVQIVLETLTSDTAFFIDDVQLTTQTSPAPVEFRGLWVDAYHKGIKSQQQIDELIETALAGSINALVVQVLRRADTYYPSAINPWAPDANQGFDALAYLIDRAHAAGIEVHAWATTLALWSSTAAPPTAEGHIYAQHGPGSTGGDLWLMTNEDGEEKAGNLYYLDPAHPEVVRYTTAIYAELAKNYDLDGVHLDRVRYPGDEWGYNPTALARFQALTGRSDRPAPDDAQWLQWRRDQLTGLVRAAYLGVTAIDPRIQVSVAASAAGGAPSGFSGWYVSTPYNHHLQDWVGWLEEGNVDLALPMIYRDEDTYPGHFDRWLAWAGRHQAKRYVVAGTGLYLNDVADSMAQWQAARAPTSQGDELAGLTGYSYAVPNSDGTPRREFVNAAVSEVFTRSALAPDLPWKEKPTLGHLAGALYPPLPCLPSLDGHSLVLSGSETRDLLTDGTGWYGAVDLPPGEYVLETTSLPAGMNTSQPFIVEAGAVTQADLLLACTQSTWGVYLPQVLKGIGR